MAVKLNHIYCVDCFKGMRYIPSGSVDMVLCDLPFGVTHNKWDSVIPLPMMWRQYMRILKCNGSVVLFSIMPFSAVLITSNMSCFQYSLVWEKNHATGHLDAYRRPLRKHEDILIFARLSYQNSLSIYHPQMVEGKPYVRKFNRKTRQESNGSNYGVWKGMRPDVYNSGTRHPVSVLRFSREVGLHPTQKPVALFEYLIRTYTNEGDTVLDNCMGSGTTAIACINTKRNFIGFEIEPKYVRLARERIKKHLGWRAEDFNGFERGQTAGAGA